MFEIGQTGGSYGETTATINLGYKPTQVMIWFMHMGEFPVNVHYDTSRSTKLWYYSYSYGTSYGSANLNALVVDAWRFNVTNNGFTFSTQYGNVYNNGWYMASKAE